MIFDESKLYTCVKPRWGQGRVESRHGLLQLGFLGTEVETELKVQDLHRGSEINTGRREGENTGGGNREHDVVLRGAPVLPTGSSGVGMALWRHPRSGKGLDLYVPALDTVSGGPPDTWRNGRLCTGPSWAPEPNTRTVSFCSTMGLCAARLRTWARQWLCPSLSLPCLPLNLDPGDLQQTTWAANNILHVALVHFSPSLDCVLKSLKSR